MPHKDRFCSISQTYLNYKNILPFEVIEILAEKELCLFDETLMVEAFGGTVAL